MKTAIQGEKGSFHELAAQHWFGPDIQLVCCDSFSQLFKALYNGSAHTAVCAVENSLYGSINEVYDLLTEYKFPIIGEVHEHIHQNLIALPGAQLNNISRVYSHPVALSQCQDFLDQNLPAADLINHHDTAAAVDYIKTVGNPQYAAIASANAASSRNLHIIAPNIEDMSTNYTRFLVLQPNSQPPVGANKTSLVLKTNHQPGALYKALGVLANAGFNLTKLQSRPITGKVWKYQFYIDIDAAGEPLRKAIKELGAQKCDVTVLGEYKQAKTAFTD